MDTDEPDSTPGEGVLFHNTHCAELLQADPQALCHLHSMGEHRLRCERLCYVFRWQRLRPFRGSSTTIVFASRALSCSFPSGASCPTHHPIGRPPQPPLARVADDSACEYS